MAVRKVLVVDDSPTDLANIKDIMTEAGCVVITATNGHEAIQRARSDKPDIIFMDIIMPDMDGYAACRSLSTEAATKEIPVVFVTSKTRRRIACGPRCKAPRPSSPNPTTPMRSSIN